LDKGSELKSYMDESSLKAPIQMDFTLVPSFKKTMEVQSSSSKTRRAY